MSLFFNGQPALKLSMHLPLNGAWSAELDVSSDVVPEVGAAATITLPGDILWQGRVVRAGVSDERLRVRMTGGSQDWSQQIDLKHYHNTDGDQALRDLGVQAEAPLELDLPFWTRPPGTIGAAVQALATLAGVNWRINPNGQMRIRAEAPFAVSAEAIEVSRDPARGIVEVAPDIASIMPGVTVGDDQVGDVVYEFSDVLRCRYYTEQRARLRGSLEKIIRWVMRDTLFHGQYTAQVVTQNADGTLDLLPEDVRLRAQGLQSVPIRHGLPGVRVTVAPGSRVLLGFDNGKETQPYAALWHEGQVLSVEIGGAVPVALGTLVDANFAAILAWANAHTHPVAGALAGPSLLPAPLPPPAPTQALVLKTL